MGAPPEWEIVALGAFAGLTIFLGMPFARATRIARRTRALLSAVAAGILLFIFYDVLANANELIGVPLGAGATSTASVDAVILAVGLTVGLVGLMGFEREYRRHARETDGAVSAPPTSLDPKSLATMIAVGIGLHNFSEGLAIGASFAGGALTLGTVLVVGFAIHNSTEGFGILGPGMLSGVRFSVPRLLALGLVGGGPTFLGTVAGSLVVSDPLSILFYGLAAGAILYVVLQITRPLLQPATREAATLGLLLGFLLGFTTDFVVRVGGG